MASRGIAFSFFHLFTVGDRGARRQSHISPPPRPVPGPTARSQGRSRECLSPGQTVRPLWAGDSGVGAGGALLASDYNLHLQGTGVSPAESIHRSGVEGTRKKE